MPVTKASKPDPQPDPPKGKDPAPKRLDPQHDVVPDQPIMDTTVDPSPDDPHPVQPTKARKVADGMCAASDGTPHFGDGSAIPGTQVCSAHEIHFFRDGTPRTNPDGTRRA
jgi:hypothetical protein